LKVVVIYYYPGSREVLQAQPEKNYVLHHLPYTLLNNLEVDLTAIPWRTDKEEFICLEFFLSSPLTYQAGIRRFFTSVQGEKESWQTH
jgi:hypothetical protein